MVNSVDGFAACALDDRHSGGRRPGLPPPGAEGPNGGSYPQADVRGYARPRRADSQLASDLRTRAKNRPPNRMLAYALRFEADVSPLLREIAIIRTGQLL